MKRSEAFPSRFFKADEVSGKGETYTIKEVKKEEFTDQKTGEIDEKPCITFSDHEKMLIVNATNWDRIAKQYGDESNKWKGKKVTLVLEAVTAFGKTSDCIRVKN